MVEIVFIQKILESWLLECHFLEAVRRVGVI